MSLPYIGSTITLISKAENRYVGKLAQIDQQQATVTLQGVRSFGTEGRRPGSDIPPSDQVFEYIVFRGSDIKDLHVSAEPVVAAPLHQDPAVVSSTRRGPSSSAAASAAPVSSEQQTATSRQSDRQAPRQNKQPTSYSSAAKPAENGKSDNSPARDQNRRQTSTTPSSGNNNNNSDPDSRPRQPRQPRPPREPRQPAKTVEVPKDDFDFESANAKLVDKNSMMPSEEDAELLRKLEEIKLGNYYDKKTSFFDNISSDIKDRSDGAGEEKPIIDRQKMRDSNVETFGVAGVRTNYRRGGRGGSRGGGRGRGRGRGRGASSTQARAETNGH